MNQTKKTGEAGVAVLGFGTVGAGVMETLLKNGDLLAARLGVRPVLRAVADLDVVTDRGVAVPEGLLTTDAAGAIARDDVDIVVELIGGCGAAKQFVLAALAAGKTVVTANKKLLAEHGEEIFAAAKAGGAPVFFEASVGGGIPIIKALAEGLCANRIRSIHGILNGTCNYILTRMEEEQLDFGGVLADAQAKGYAEAEPSLDIDGFDTAHKAAVLATLAYGGMVRADQVRVAGIRGISRDDIAYAAELGYRIKLLATIRDAGGEGIEVGVQPTLVAHGHPLAAVGGVFNAVQVEGDVVGTTLYYGRGAGRAATASAVVADIADAALQRATGGPWRIGAAVREGTAPTLREAGRAVSRHYIRLSLRDKVGTLAQVARILGENDIGIASVVQQDAETRHAAYVPVIFITGRAEEAAVLRALECIEAAEGLIDCAPVRYRIEDFGE